MLRQRRERGVQPVVEAARAQAVGDLAQLGDGRAQLGDGLVEQAVHIACAVVEVSLGQAQRHAERDEPLLGAVVQVALEPAALLVAGMDEPGAAGLDLAQRRRSSRRSRTTSTSVARGGRDLAQQLRRQEPRAAGSRAPIGAPPIDHGHVAGGVEPAPPTRPPGVPPGMR